MVQNPKTVPPMERIATKLPLFSDDMPEIWNFKQTLAKVLDVIKASHEKTPYTHFKEHVLSRLSTSEEVQLSKLLCHVEMGDRSPSELYRHMVQLAGGSVDISATLIQKLWKSRLPKSIEVALLAADFKNHDEQM